MSETHTIVSSSRSSSIIMHNQKGSPSSTPYSQAFLDKSLAPARAMYFKALFAGAIMVIITILTILPIYWGSLWKTPLGRLDAWVVDFDQGIIGQAVVQGLTNLPQQAKLRFTPVTASNFPGGPGDLSREVIQERAWAIVSINPGASARLQASYISPNASYNGSEAITFWAAEARNENAFRTISRTTVNDALTRIQASFAANASRQLNNNNNNSSATIQAILATSPQTLVTPIFYTTHNAAPFDHPVASAVTFVGLIYMIILAQFSVMISLSARESSGLSRTLSLRSIIITRLATSFTLYFILSLFFSLLSLAFQLDFTRRFGRVGFLIFWMVNWVGMLALGLALESLVTILTPAFIPFFMVTWIIVNVSVAIFPLETLPSIYKYGYSMPFYNVSHAVRCIVFGTKNQIGMNFGILLAWTVVSCTTLVFFQWFTRRRALMAPAAAAATSTSTSTTSGHGATAPGAGAAPSLSASGGPNAHVDDKETDADLDSVSKSARVGSMDRVRSRGSAAGAAGAGVVDLERQQGGESLTEKS